jgi:hypothetical protein
VLPRRIFRALALALSASGRAISRRLRSEDFLITAAYVGGLGAIAVGVGLIYVPAGCIVAGGAAAASALVYAGRSSSGGGDQ